MSRERFARNVSALASCYEGYRTCCSYDPFLSGFFKGVDLWVARAYHYSMDVGDPSFDMDAGLRNVVSMLPLPSEGLSERFVDGFTTAIALFRRAKDLYG